MKKRTFRILSLSVLLALTLAFIWGHSMESISKSQETSAGVLDWLMPILTFLHISEWFTDHVLRKLTHFAEFAALGGELMLFALLLGRQSRTALTDCLFLGLLAAVIDETIQIVSRRGSQAQDVLLDFCGVCFGVMIIRLFFFRKKRHIAKRAANGS